ncbi:MAG TPA: DUF429 domain-containing protein [Thermoanaerobaculia bacterium]|nr:DUF429 domain-containing protein [Thermoanaerobaculia bacterium]
MGVRVTPLTPRGDARGNSFSIDVPFASIGDCHVATIRPGAVRGNHFHEQRREILVVLYTAPWTLLWDEGEGTPVQSQTFTGSGAVLMEADPLCAHAVRNDGSAELQIFSLGDKHFTDTHPRRLAEPQTRLAGVDGCGPDRWIAMVKDGDVITPRVCTGDDELLALFRECVVVAIDIPIGLTDSGPRCCDHHARRSLRHRGASVFPAPVRAVLNAHDYVDANKISRLVQKKGMSQQAWAIVAKIRQVDALLQRHPELRARVYEVHPEVTFAHWNGEPLPVSKHKPEGRAARRRLVEDHFKEFQRPRGVKEDDALDAYAALWTAERIARGAHAVLGDAHSDSTGLPMRIVY